MTHVDQGFVGAIPALGGIEKAFGTTVLVLPAVDIPIKDELASLEISQKLTRLTLLRGSIRALQA